MRTNNKQEKGKVRMTRGIIPPLGSLRLIGYRIRDTRLRGVIAAWMGILALASPLMVFADTTIIQSWPSGLTNFQIYKSTDPTGTLAKTLTRSYDALNRLQTLTGIGQEK